MQQMEAQSSMLHRTPLQSTAIEAFQLNSIPICLHAIPIDLSEQTRWKAQICHSLNNSNLLRLMMCFKMVLKKSSPNSMKLECVA